MKILVTGGAGFIGNHLCRKLISQGHYVICLDNFSTGCKENIHDLFGNSFELIEHNIIEPINIEVDQIYHLACPASPISYQSNPIETIKTNIHGTINCLEIAKKYHAKILYTSTSEIYGDPEINPQVEEYNGNVNPLGIRACYDEGKRLGETLMMEYYRNYNVNIRIARIFNTYGSNMSVNDGRVISNIINQCLDSKDITIYGNGTQTRSFCYIDDMVNGLISLMNNNIIGPINLGNPCEITIVDLATKIKNLIGNDCKIIYYPIPQDDPKKRKPNIDKAKEYLQWEPLIDLDTGLIKTIEYFISIK
jgi:UDP-glucuronate decarboxylase